MSNLPGFSITYRFAGDLSASNRVNAAALDTQLGNIATAQNQTKAALDRITDGSNNLAAQTVGLAQLKPEVFLELAEVAFELTSEIPAQSLVQVVETIAALRAITPPLFNLVYEVQGYYAAGDGGGGFFRWSASDATADNGGTVITPNAGGTGRWNRIHYENLNIRHFGVHPGQTGVVNAAAMTQALTVAATSGDSVFVPDGDYTLTAAEYVLSSAMTIRGQSRSGSILRFAGSPSKTIRTNVVWRTEYDSADYTNSSDAAIACAFIVTTTKVDISNLTILADTTVLANYPVPFNSATDFPTSVYDVGILVQAAGCTIENVEVIGPWLNAAVRGDCSKPSGGIDQLKITNCKLSGMWGLRLEGAQGAPVSGDEYADLAGSDTRTAVGASDTTVFASEIYDTSGYLRLTIDGNANRLVRRSATGGGLFISGQNRFNSAKRMQGIRFVNCRFATCDRYVYKVNYANRVEFTGCHSEFRAGSFDTDGVTALTGADCEILTTTYARRIIYHGGERSGETDNRTFKDTASNTPIICELGYDNADPPGSTPAKRMLTVDACGDRAVFTPSLTAGTPGTPTYSTQTGSYVKIGNMVYVQGRIILSSLGGITGNISIAGLPFTASNLFGSTPQGLLTCQTSDVITGDCGTGAIVAQTTSTAALTKIRSGASIQNITEADLDVTSRIDFSGWYQTEDA